MSANQSEPEGQTLEELALVARQSAYAPYSGYQVGCALIAESGAVYTGANVENASYGLCVCAERSAIVQAVLAGERNLKEIVVATQSSPPAAPCGLCRQTINEFSNDPETLRVVMINHKGERSESLFSELFPQGFRGSELGSAPNE